MKKEGTKLVLSPKFSPHKSFIPSFGFALPTPSLLALFLSLNQVLSKIKSCKSYELIAYSIKQYPVSLTFQLHSSWGWNREYMVKPGPKDGVT
jgi:hypothetical protein